MCLFTQKRGGFKCEIVFGIEFGIKFGIVFKLNLGYISYHSSIYSRAMTPASLKSTQFFDAGSTTINEWVHYIFRQQTLGATTIWYKFNRMMPFIKLLHMYLLKWRILSQTGKIGSGKNTKFLFFLLGLKYTLRTCFESKNFSSNSCPELSNHVLSFSACPKAFMLVCQTQHITQPKSILFLYDQLSIKPVLL